MRRVLFDEDVPRQLRRDLPEFEIRTVQEEGWTSAKNGELLRLCSSIYDVLVTADKRLRFQQNIASFNKEEAELDAALAETDRGGGIPLSEFLRQIRERSSGPTRR